MKKSKLTLTKELSAARKAFKQARKENTEILQDLVAALRLLITENPMIESMSWAQYTPYFNDGSTCEFGVNTIEISLTELGTNLLNDRCRAPYGDRWEVGESYYLFNLIDAIESTTDIINFEQLSSTIKLLNTLEKVNQFLSDSADELKTAFGDHAKIVVDNSGIAVEEYDHD